jgi:23S rRNA pseudouridine1911/1915/1917 synthase
MPPDPESGSRRIVVEAAAGRLDAWLAGHLADLSRNRVAQLLAEGRILVNGSVARKSYRPAPGDVVEVDVPPAVPSAVEAESIPLDIIYEDADLLVVDKPAGLVVHPAPGHRSGTLVNALLHHIGDLSGIGGVLRPGIVHRLDKDTSGLMIVAKNDRAHRALSAALRTREIRRVYTLAVWGHLSADLITVDAPIGRARTDRKRMAVVAVGTGRPAVTRLRRVALWPAADLVTAELETGRTHQIRVHVAHIGHPVVGDATYGGRALRGISGPARQWARELDRRVGRQFLHAAELHFAHPRTRASLSFRSPLPQDLAAAADWAAATASGG